MGDFLPILFDRLIYKLLIKVLVCRLIDVMDKLIFSNQITFLKGILLVDGVVDVNELVDLAKKSRKCFFIFKVDFRKEYDSVSWSFQDYMLSIFGFNDKCRSWICACVFSCNLAILVNGFPNQEIRIQRGLKQGDPLSPFFFLLVAESLSELFSRAVDLQIFWGLRVGSSYLVVSHLQYADDTIILEESSYENIWSIRRFSKCLI